MERETGKIKKYFSKARPSVTGKFGFGFIVRTGKPDLWFHRNEASSLIAEIGEVNLQGLAVNFIVSSRAGKEQAEKIEVDPSALSISYAVTEHEQFVIGKSALPVVKWTVSCGGKELDQRSGFRLISTEDYIKTEWPADICSRAAEALARYQTAKDQAVSEIKWPETPATLQKLEIPYDDGVISGKISSYVAVEETGIVQRAYLLSPQIFGRVSGIERVISTAITKKGEAVAEIDSVEIFLKLAEQFGQPSINEVVFKEFHKKGKVSWGNFTLNIDPEVLFSIPGIEIELGEIKTYSFSTTIEFSLILALPKGDCFEAKGFSLTQEHLKYRGGSFSGEGESWIIMAGTHGRGPVVERAHFNKWGRKLTPELIKNDLRGQLVFCSLLEYEDEWRELLLEWNRRSGYESNNPIMSRLYAKQERLNDLLQSAPEPDNRSLPESRYEPESPDGMRGDCHYTVYILKRGYSWGVAKHWREHQSEKNRQEVWLDLIRLESEELLEIFNQLETWFSLAAYFEGESEPGWYTISSKTFEVSEGASIRKDTVEKVFDQILGEVDNIICRTRTFSVSA